MQERWSGGAAARWRQSTQWIRNELKQLCHFVNMPESIEHRKGSGVPCVEARAVRLLYTPAFLRLKYNPVLAARL